MRHHFGAEQLQRTQRVGKRHRAEEQIGQKIIDARVPRPAARSRRARSAASRRSRCRRRRRLRKFAPRGTLSREVKPVWPCIVRSQLMCARCASMAGLPKRMASASVSATKMCRCTPIAAPPGNSALGCAGAAALFERGFVGVDIGLGASPSARASRNAGPASPAQVEPISFDEPYQNGGCGCCSGRSAIGTFS